MDDKVRDAIGLLRHKIISPVLMDSGRGQMRYFREISVQEFDVPGQGKKRFSASTMKGWLNRYRKHGFPALVPAVRCDRGTLRIGKEVRDSIVKLREDNMDLSVAKFYERCLKAQILGESPMCNATMHRFLKVENLFTAKTPKARKKYEMSQFGELWVGDFMHGPMVVGNKDTRRARKAILLAIIDDYSRVIVGAGFSLQETTLPIEIIFKDALLKFGMPDRLYLDNGPAFSSHYLAKVCANLGIGLVHSKPYDSPSRGKIERFFRTVRECFLVDFKTSERLELGHLNERFSVWLRDEYHNRVHSGIDSRPIDRYQLSLGYRPRRRVDENVLSEFFLVSAKRVVKNDATISYNGDLYEVPARFIGKTVELRFAQDCPTDVYLYDDGLRVQRLKIVDAKENGRIYRPQPRDTVIPFQAFVKSNDLQQGNGSTKND